MAHINKIEIQGIIGMVRVAPMVHNGPRAFKLSVATDYCFKGRDGSFIVETTWHSVSIAESVAGEYDWLQKGKGIHVTGRVRNVRYTSASGETHSLSEIVAETVSPVE